MIHPIRHIARKIEQEFEKLDGYDLISHPLKKYSRRALGMAVCGAPLICFLVIGGLFIYRMLDTGSVKEIELTPYPAHLIDIIDPSTLITSEKGGGGGGGQRAGGEAPEDPGDDIMSKGIPMPVVVGFPEPIDDSLIAEEHEIASQEEMRKEIALARDEDVEPTDEVGMRGTGGNENGEQGTGGGDGTGGGGGDGPPGTWRYDTPPMPRRINMSISKKEVPKKLRHVKNSVVKFRLLINELGEVIDASIVASTGYKEIDDLLLGKAYTFLYHPATLKGQSVKAWIAVGYGYRGGK
jgi:hypothetical protein